jgi:N-acetylneuraminic acid mutarotase
MKRPFSPWFSSQRLFVQNTFFSALKTMTQARRAALTCVLCLVAWGTLCPAARAQAGEWAWMSGVETGSNSVYGTKGVAAAANVPGNREGAATWIDASGNLWLFGGEDSNGNEYNDLWKFNPSTGYWTWMSGSSTSAGPGTYGTEGTATATNVPGGREGAISWIDSSGNLWLLGGYGWDSAHGFGDLNDLWEFNPSTGYWTWINGSSKSRQPGVYGTLGVTNGSNVPGGRDSGAAWVDSSGIFWLFGGAGFDASGKNDELNDLWKFDSTANKWTWMGGSSIGGQSGTYGTEGTASSTNIPGGREGATVWTDSSRNVCLFGGKGYDASGNDDMLNDLWKFNPSAGYWTWVSGSNAATQSGTYGAQVGTVGTPGGRSNASGWIDSSDNLWLFGGMGYDSQGNEGAGLNDFWEFNPSSSEWTWIGGDSTILDGWNGQPGVYGTEGVASSSNIPGSRYHAGSWTDTSGNFWLFGGNGYDINDNEGDLNDLWKYKFAVSTAALPVFSPAAGTYTSDQSVKITDSTAGATIYYTTDGSTPTTNSTQYTGAITVSSSETIKAIAAASGYSNSYVASAAYGINIPPTVATPTFDPTPGTYADAQIVTITDSTPNATIYYTTNGSTPTTSSNMYTGGITVSVPTTIEAIAVASGYLNSASASASYSITQPTPVLSSISPRYISSGTAFTLTVTGSDFTPGSVAYWGSVALTTYVSSTQLTAQVTTANASVSGTGTYADVAISVKTPGAVGTSSSIKFALVSPNSSSFPMTITPATATVTTGESATFAVTFTNATSGNIFSCLNLPTGASCNWVLNPNSYTVGTLTIATSSATPTGTYTITLLGNGTIPVTTTSSTGKFSNAGIVLSALFFPLLFLRRRMKARGVWPTVCIGLVLLASTSFFVGCASGGPKVGLGPVSETTSASNASTITLIVQ